MKVCLRSALYPDLTRAGVTGLFMPVIIPRLGYCEYNCTLCGQVCPTGAIPRLPLEQKRKSVIGTAVIDKNTCLPYAKKLNCLVKNTAPSRKRRSASKRWTTSTARAERSPSSGPTSSITSAMAAAYARTNARLKAARPWRSSREKKAELPNQRGLTVRGRSAVEVRATKKGRIPNRKGFDRWTR